MTTRLLTLASFALAAGLAAWAALAATSAIEARSAQAVAAALEAGGADFAAVEADGLRLTLTGTALSESQRFRALTLAGGAVDPARVIDAMSVAGGPDLAPPRFSVEMLRGRDGVSLIGLVPAGTDRAALLRRLDRAHGCRGGRLPPNRRAPGARAVARRARLRARRGGAAGAVAESPWTRTGWRSSPRPKAPRSASGSRRSSSAPCPRG